MHLDSFSSRNQWAEGDDIPASWKKYYQFNPCVPTDYSSIHTAIRKATVNAIEDSSDQKKIRVLLRPGRYDLRKAITTYDNGIDDGNDTQSVSVTIETMTYSPSNFGNGDRGNNVTQSRQSSNKSKRKLKSSIRNIFRCRTVDVESEQEEDLDSHDSFGDDLYDSPLPSEETIESASSDDREVERATLVLSTRRHDEPLVRVTKGSFTMRNVNLRHGCSGNGK